MPSGFAENVHTRSIPKKSIPFWSSRIGSRIRRKHTVRICKYDLKNRSRLVTPASWTYHHHLFISKESGLKGRIRRFDPVLSHLIVHISCIFWNIDKIWDYITGFAETWIQTRHEELTIRTNIFDPVLSHLIVHISY